MKPSPLYSLIIFLGGVTWVIGHQTHAGQIDEARSESTLGKATNGLQGAVRLISHSYSNNYGEIVVFVNRINERGEPQQLPAQRELEERLANNDFDIFMAPNTFCGPVEVRDDQGNTVRSLKPEVTGRDAYPPFLSLKEEHSKFFSAGTNKLVIWNGAQMFPVPLMVLRSSEELARFEIVGKAEADSVRRQDKYFRRTLVLGDYFDIKEAGEFTFTFSPKIYQRTATNGDVCARVDLPPVSVKIKIDASALK
jgi:hypothetical protein